MEKAGDIIKDALSEITVYGAEASVESVDAQLAIRYMNRLFATLDADGIDLGYTEVTSFADDMTIPAGANAGAVTGLAVSLWSQFSEGSPIPMDLVARWRSDKNSMRNIAVTVGASEYPDTLPIGSGNEDDTDTGHFYPDLESTILAETNGSIGLESETE
jgi:hypothetical protein